MTVGLASCDDGLWEIVPRDDLRSDHETTVPIHEIFPYQLNDLVCVALPDLTMWYPRPRHTSVRPGETAAVWRIPYPEPDVRANFPFVVEALSQTVVVAATPDDGEDLPLVVQLTTANGGWAPVRGWPSPGFVVPTSAVVYPRDDGERASLDGEDHAVAFLVKPLGNETVIRVFGGVYTGSAVAEAVTRDFRDELRAECAWRAIVPPRWPGQPLAAIPQADDTWHAVLPELGGELPQIPSHWPKWAETFVGLYPKYLAGAITMDGLAAEIHRRHPDFVWNGAYLTDWRYKRHQEDPDIVDRLLPYKDPGRA